MFPRDAACFFPKPPNARARYSDRYSGPEMAEMIKPGYFVGLGSNLQPERNVPGIIRLLIEEFGALRVSPVLRTRPVGIHTPHDFFNAVVYVETDLPSNQLKEIFNNIEERLGRDRADTARHTKDRPADLDIVMDYRPGQALATAHFPAEPYLRLPLRALCVAMGLMPPDGRPAPLHAQALSLDGIEIGRKPCHIYSLDTEESRTSATLIKLDLA